MLQGIPTELVTVSGLLATMIFLALYAVLVPRPSTNFKPAPDADSTSMKMAGLLGTELINSLPAEFVYRKRDKSKIHSLIKRSGNPWRVTADEFFFLQFVCGFVGFLASWGVWFVLGIAVTLPWYVIVPLITVGAFFWPRYKYSYTAKQRELEFKKQLPEALDMLKITLSSGTSLQRSIKDVSVEMDPGVLRKEFVDMTRRYESGMTMEHTLDRFADSAPSEAVESFVKSIKQAQTLSVSMVETLEQRSAASRSEYMAMIDKRIATLSTRMMAALTPTLIPALMITVLAPTLITIMDALGGGGGF